MEAPHTNSPPLTQLSPKELQDEGERFELMVTYLHDMFPGTVRRGIVYVVKKEKGNLEKCINRILNFVDKVATGEVTLKKTKGKEKVDDDPKQEEKQQNNNENVNQLQALFPHINAELIEDVYMNLSKDFGATVKSLQQFGTIDVYEEQNIDKENKESSEENSEYEDEDIVDDDEDCEEIVPGQILSLKRLCFGVIKQNYFNIPEADIEALPDPAKPQLLNYLYEAGVFGTVTTPPPQATHTVQQRPINSVDLGEVEFDWRKFLDDERSQMEEDEALARQLYEEEQNNLREGVEREEQDLLLAKMLQEKERQNDATGHIDPDIAKNDELLAKLLAQENESNDQLYQDALLARKLAEGEHPVSAEDKVHAVSTQSHSQSQSQSQSQSNSQSNSHFYSDEHLAYQLSKQTDQRDGDAYGTPGKSSNNKVKNSRSSNSSRYRNIGNALDKIGSMLNSNNSVKVTNIERVFSRSLENAFEAYQNKLKLKNGLSDPHLAFHGTSEGNIESILQRGLLVPGGSSGVSHTTDSGWWGRGIYLSPDCNVSLGYCQGGKLLVCYVLLGHTWYCTRRCDGEPCRDGYDSHMSPCGNEFVLFHSAQVLPMYIVHFERQEIMYASLSYTPAPYTATTSSSSTSSSTSTSTSRKGKKKREKGKKSAYIQRQERLARKHK